MKQLASWLDEFTTEESTSIACDLALKHTARLPASKVLLDISDLIRARNFKALCDYELDYTSLSFHEAVLARQALAFFSKNPYIDLGADKEGEALSKFFLSEEKCRETNELFSMRDQGSFLFEPWVESAIRRAQHKIARVLGELPRLADLKLRFGPGATTLTKKKNASIVEKLQTSLACSEELLPYVSRLLEELPHIVDFHWKGASRSDGDFDYGHIPVEIHHGVMCFVLKNAKTHRIIIKQPPLNTLVQSALGDEMARKLKRNGIDITDQGINKSLAQLGSLTGELCTLDLVDASGRIAIAIPNLLLPWEWSFMLGTTRVGKACLPGQSQRDTPFTLQHFSGMGDGCTFPLETLIFWSLASSVAEDGFVSVYGDDIVCKSRDVQRIMRLFQIFGFEVNVKKSFWTGPFRESCGGDYLSGMDIRPYYHKQVVNGPELFKMHNYFVRHLDPEMAEAVLKYVPDHLRIWGPDGYGDGHLIGDWIPKRRKSFYQKGFGGYLFDSFKLVGALDMRYNRPGDRILPLYTIYARESGDSVFDNQAQETVHFESGRDPHSVSKAFSLGKRRRFDFRMAPEPLPERESPVDGVVRKTPSFPGTQGYKRVSIYTLSLS